MPNRYAFTATKQDIADAIAGIPWCLSDMRATNCSGTKKRKVSVMPEVMQSDYQRFIKGKVRDTQSFGFTPLD